MNDLTHKRLQDERNRKIQELLDVYDSKGLASKEELEAPAYERIRTLQEDHADAFYESENLGFEAIKKTLGI